MLFFDLSKYIKLYKQNREFVLKLNLSKKDIQN
jgi:hypothetical protein